MRRTSLLLWQGNPLAPMVASPALGYGPPGHTLTGRGVVPSGQPLVLWAIFHLSSGQLAPHPPLQRAYFSTLRSPKSLEKHSVSRLSYLFSHLHLLSSYSFSSTLLSSNLSLLSASSLLCFSSVHIVGSLTSKLPSIIHTYIYIRRT